MGERIGKMPAMGIDLGTTYSCVAIWQSGEVVIIPNEQGNRTTPSYVAFTESECLVGDAAKSQAAMNSSNTVFDVKRLIGRKFKDESIQNDIQLWPFKVIPGRPDEDHPKKAVIVVNHKGEEKEYLPEQISAMVLSRMKEVADSYVGAPVKNVVITVPAYFNNEQRQATRDAGAIAGMNVLRLVNEPTAAAIAFGFHKTRGVEKNVLIFDLGGGTLDVSLITIENDVFEVKSVSGNTRLGGQDFDNKLVHLFVGEFKQKCQVDIRKDSRAIERLRTACEKAKRALSSTTAAKIDIDCLFKGIDFCSNISRVRFEKLNKGLFQQCLAPVRTCLKDARMDATDVDEVVLVGGSTRIPKIQELLHRMFPGKRLCKNIHPDEAVAHGAAVYAALLSCVEDKNFLLIDVTPLSLGVENNTGRMSVLIPKNTTIPTRMTKVFTTTENNQTEVTFNVYEGERATAKKNNLLGTFELSGIPPAPKGEPVINVWFDIDADGIMECHAEEQANYNRNGIRITCRNNGRLSEEEIATLMAEAEKLKAEEEKHKLKIKAAYNVEEYAEEMRDMLKCRSMTKTDSKKMSDAIDHTLKWLDWNFLLTEVCKYQEKLEELQAICVPIASNLHIPCYCVDEDADFMDLSD